MLHYWWHFIKQRDFSNITVGFKTYRSTLLRLNTLINILIDFSNITLMLMTSIMYQMIYLIFFLKSKSFDTLLRLNTLINIQH